MKIIYIANIRIPTEKAHGIQIMKMCEAFTNNGHDVELVVPWRINNLTQDPFEYYGLKGRFKITRIFSWDLIKYGRFGFIMQSFTFGFSSFFYTLFNSVDVVFGRDELPLLFISFHHKVVWETHTGSYNLSTKMLLKRCDIVVAITQGLKDFYMKNGVDEKKILVAPDAVDAEQFDINISMEEARTKLNLPKDKKIILYTGHLYDWKGAHILAQAAALLPDTTAVAFVGGTDNDIKNFKERFGDTKNIMILGKKPYEEMPMYLKAADILTLPNSPVNDISSLYTSPMKLFEYMAAGRAIIASNLASIREILETERNAILVEPDRPELLAEGIKRIISDSALDKRISDEAYKDSKLYTWLNRARSIVSFIKA